MVNTFNQSISGKTSHFTQFAVLSPASGATPESTTEDDFVNGGRPNWLLISINIVIVLLALAYLFLFRFLKRKLKKSGK